MVYLDVVKAVVEKNILSLGMVCLDVVEVEIVDAEKMTVDNEVYGNKDTIKSCE